MIAIDVEKYIMKTAFIATWVECVNFHIKASKHKAVEYRLIVWSHDLHNQGEVLNSYCVQ